MQTVTDQFFRSNTSMVSTVQRNNTKMTSAEELRLISTPSLAYKALPNIWIMLSTANGECRPALWWGKAKYTEWTEILSFALPWHSRNASFQWKWLGHSSGRKKMCPGHIWVLRRALPARQSPSLANKFLIPSLQGDAPIPHAAFPGSAEQGCSAGRQEQRAEAALRRMPGEQTLPGDARREVVFHVRLLHFPVITVKVRFSQCCAADTKFKVQKLSWEPPRRPDTQKLDCLQGKVPD